MIASGDWGRNKGMGWEGITKTISNFSEMLYFLQKFGTKWQTMNLKHLLVLEIDVNDNGVCVFIFTVL